MPLAPARARTLLWAALTWLVRRAPRQSVRAAIAQTFPVVSSEFLVSSFDEKKVMGFVLLSGFLGLVSIVSESTT